jgi:hypothetical protein
VNRKIALCNIPKHVAACRKLVEANNFRCKIESRRTFYGGLRAASSRRRVSGVARAQTEGLKPQPKCVSIPAPHSSRKEHVTRMHLAVHSSAAIVQILQAGQTQRNTSAKEWRSVSTFTTNNEDRRCYMRAAGVPHLQPFREFQNDNSNVVLAESIINGPISHAAKAFDVFRGIGSTL